MKLLKAPYCYLIHWLSDYRLLKIVLFEFFFKIVLNFAFFFLTKLISCRSGKSAEERWYQLKLVMKFVRPSSSNLELRDVERQ